MRPLRASPLFALALGALAIPAVAPAAKKKQPSIYESKQLWATVNICDTAKYPDGIGVRASMPGSGRKSETMFIRFQVQYKSVADGKWHNLGTGGDSGFFSIGAANYKRRETGRTFTITPPASGSVLVRGAVTYEWRKAGEVVRRARKQTAGGHPTSSDVKTDPDRFTAATCTIKT